MEVTASMRLAPFHKVLAFLDSTPILEHATLAARAAAGALVRTRSLLRAIIALVEAEGVRVTEADVLVRVLLEMAITMAWIGTDEERAGLYRDHGVRKAKTWMRAMEDHGTEFGPRVREPFEAHVREGRGGTLPPLEQLATQTRADQEPVRGWVSLKREYDFIYRRLSAAVHHDDRLQALIEPLLGKDALAVTLNAAAIATGVLLSSVAVPLGIPAAYALGMKLVAGGA